MMQASKCVSPLDLHDLVFCCASMSEAWAPASRPTPCSLERKWREASQPQISSYMRPKEWVCVLILVHRCRAAGMKVVGYLGAGHAQADWNRKDLTSFDIPITHTLSTPLAHPRPSLSCVCSQSKRTLLHWVVYRGRLALIDPLAEKGALINVQASVSEDPEVCASMSAPISTRGSISASRPLSAAP